MVTRPLGVARLRGIEVRLDPSLLLLGFLVVWVFTTRFAGRFSWPVALVMAMAGAGLVVLTTLAHELAHALEARHRKVEVEAITLLLFGGITEMHAKDQRPRDELAIAIIGPWVSLVCGATLGLVSLGAGTVLPPVVGDPVAEVAGLLAWWNILLALFNALPAAPLDGGRVLRALVWMLTGTRMGGLRVSVRAGQLLGSGLVLAGGWVAWRAASAPRGLPLLLFTGLLVATGVFLIHSATRELRNAEFDDALTGWTVRSLLLALPDHRTGAHEVPDSLPTVEADLDLHGLIDAFQGEHDTVRVVVSGTPVDALTQREVAAALGRLRRTGHPGPVLPEPAAEPPTRDTPSGGRS